MPTNAEYNQFRRLVGDNYATPTIGDDVVGSYLNDAVYELTMDFATPITVFDTLVVQYHNEAVYKAALNYWWYQLSIYEQRHSVTVGSASQDVGERWGRILQMIQELEARYDEIQQLRIDITIGNFSRYSKQTLRRIGGIAEEDTNA